MSQAQGSRRQCSSPPLASQRRAALAQRLTGEQRLLRLCTLGNPSSAWLSRRSFPTTHSSRIFYCPPWGGAHLTNHGQGQVRPKNYTPHCCGSRPRDHAVSGRS